MEGNDGMATALNILITIYAAYSLLKFAFFFVLRYGARRKALDKAYGDRPSATRMSDNVLLGVMVLLSAALVVRGGDPTGFLGGLLIGATLIQLFFHRFDRPLRPERMPAEPVSPIKTMSYAIQDAPGRAWKELLMLTALIVLSLATIWSGGAVG